MNRRIISLFALAVPILFLAAAPAFAQQEDKDSPLRFGIKLGLNISDFSGDDDIEGWGELLDWKAGFCGGLFMSYEVNEWFTLQPELYYSMKGMKMGLGILDLSVAWSIDYIDIPVLAVFELPLESSLEPYVFAGPSVGFKVRSEMSASALGEEESVDLDEYTNSVDFSLVVGAGIEFDIAGQEFSFDFRWIPGLVGVFKDEVPWTDDTPNMRNDTFSFLLGYAF
jgi:hypothetical protein